MRPISKFPEDLLQYLKSFSYVLLSPIQVTEQSKHLDILFKNEDIKSLIKNLRQLRDLNNLTISSTFKSSKAILKFKDNAELVVNFVHHFTHNSIVYLDEEEVMKKRVQGSNKIFIPCVEHLFEQKILKSFLALKGIGGATFQYFSEFHILVQEDLLDYFNMKYGTSFSNIYQLTDFDDTQRTQMIKALKNEPNNRFIKKVNVRWHTFLGSIRQAKII